MRGPSAFIILMTLCAFFASTLAASTKKLIAYVVDWEVPKNIQWSKLDNIVYSFVEPNAEGALESFTSSNLRSRKFLYL
jgi:chitinase